MENKSIKILLAEDDTNLGLILNSYLAAKGFIVELTRNGNEALQRFMGGSGFDLCLIDVMMPEKDGFTLAREIKSIQPNMPLIFITAKSMQEDILKGFELGADDYISKPFSMEVLVARINAIINRSQTSVAKDSSQICKIGSLSFNHARQEIMSGDVVSKLTAREADLLKLLIQNTNQITDRKTALEIIWGNDSYFNARSMDVYITKLRKFLKADPNIELMNVHGKGYKLMVRE